MPMWVGRHRNQSTSARESNSEQVQTQAITGIICYNEQHISQRKNCEILIRYLIFELSLQALENLLRLFFGREFLRHFALLKSLANL